MTEIPPEDQIEFLLSTGRIKEAKSLFLMKDSKGANFQQRNKEFNINAGWVSLIQQLDFNDVILQLIRDVKCAFNLSGCFL